LHFIYFVFHRGSDCGSEFDEKIFDSTLFFPILIALSLVFATLSASFYLRRNHLFSFAGARRKWRYFLILYGSTLLVNLSFFYFIFPAAANVHSNILPRETVLPASARALTLAVDIPCAGHAPLIIDELGKIGGVQSVEFKMPNLFTIIYDQKIVSETTILKASIFQEFKANKL